MSRRHEQARFGIEESRRGLSADHRYDKTMKSRRVSRSAVWWRWAGLNGRPAAYESAALPTELHRHAHEINGLACRSQGGGANIIVDPSA